MKAMFIIHETDPHEYIDMMETMQNRVIESGGSCWVETQYSDKTNAKYYEYHFKCDSAKDLVG